MAKASNPRASAPSVGRSILDQVGAGGRGMLDEASWGLADDVSAGYRALTNADKSLPFERRFALEMERERAKDAYDAAHYGIARNVGRAAGVGITLLDTGGLGVGSIALRGARSLATPGVKAAVAAARGVPELKGVASVVGRLKGADKVVNKTRRIAPLNPAGLTTLRVAGGATGGVVGQAVNDAAHLQVSDPAAYAGAGLGGIAGAYVPAVRLPKIARRLPGVGSKQAIEAVQASLRAAGSGATEGAVASAAQTVLDGQPIDYSQLVRSTEAGAAAGRLGGIVGKYGSRALPASKHGHNGASDPIFSKEALGESMSAIKSIASGKWIPPVRRLSGSVMENFRFVGPNGGSHAAATEAGHQVEIALPGIRSRTIADHITMDGVAKEAKFGGSARLSRAQREALARYGASGNYQVEHYLPTDVGQIGGLFAADLAVPFTGRQAREGR